MNNTDYLKSLVHELCRLPQKECEWVEFKHNHANADEIGQYISALSNSALLSGKDKAYIVWGIDDKAHSIIGTDFSLDRARVGNEELENWLLQRLNPKINFKFESIEIDDKNVVILQINAASKHPSSFTNEKYVRIGSYKKKLKDFPEKERELWRLLDQVPFENQLSLERISKDEVLELLDYSYYFHLVKMPIPDGHQVILEALTSEDIIQRDDSGLYNITNLGAILFAKDLTHFPNLKRKAVRVIQYKGKNKLETVREQQGTKGYALGFNGLIDYIMTLMPAEENLSSPIRKETTMFPKLAVRELVVNALIHQDFFEAGSGVMIELFANRLEISNPGVPLVSVERFLDTPPKSRNEKLTSLLRRLGICEERGSGIDKVIFEIEINQLPAPVFEIPEKSTRVILFSHRKLKHLTKQERVWACYFHASLKYIEREYMTNSSLRERFGIEVKNGAMATRIINDALESGLIRVYDESVGAKARRYIPGWAGGENI
ncbi:MAG: transcriptional regulator [Spirochaeta sp. LUC14_002_19_P3]|nr:MAG: transcriptional regulator [Spirochaeta sp. LUC14_002_19_P3]